MKRILSVSFLEKRKRKKERQKAVVSSKVQDEID